MFGVCKSTASPTYEKTNDKLTISRRGRRRRRQSKARRDQRRRHRTASALISPHEVQIML